MPGDAREVLTRWFARNRGAMVTPLDEARAANVLDALAAAGLHVCADGQAVVDGKVVTLQPLSLSDVHDRKNNSGRWWKEAPDA